MLHPSTKQKLRWFAAGFTAGVIIGYCTYKTPTYVVLPSHEKLRL